MSTREISTWLFDLGNSRLKCAVLHDDGRLGDIVACAHDGSGFAPGWDRALPARIDVAHVASVAAPGLRVALLDALARRCPRISLARTRAGFAGVRIAYAQPQRLGVDRFLCLLAARAQQAGPSLIVGVGTALTIDLLDADGCHHGGRIAPSPALMRQALHQRAPHLPDGDDQGRNGYTEFADDTGAALVSGCVGAALGLVERSRAEAARAMGTMPRLLLHGGGAQALQPYLDDSQLAPALVLEGLAQWVRNIRDQGA